MPYQLVRKADYIDSNVTIDAAWPTKLGRKLLASADVRALVETRLRTAAKSRGAAILHLEIADDNVRMRISVPPQIAPLALLTHLKTDSARAIGANFPDIKRKVSTVWSWQIFIHSVGSHHAGAIDDYLRKAKGLHNAI